MASFPGVVSASFTASPRRKLTLPILDSYIFREMAPPFVIGLGAYLLFQFLNIFFLAADYVINQHASMILVLRFLILRVPQAAPLAFIFGCLFGTMLAFGRLVADNEITALRTSGISFWRIARVPLLFGLGAFLLSWFINEELAPKATQLSTRTFYQIIYHTAALPIEPQIFRKDPTTGRVFFVNTVDSVTHEMSDVMIFDRGTSSPFDSVMTAKQGYIKDGKLHLQHPTIIRFKPSGFVDVENRSEEITVGLPLDVNADEFFNQSGGDPTSLDSKTLSSQIKALQQTGTGGQAIDNLKLILASRRALPFGCFIAILVSLPLAVVFGRRGRELGMALSLTVMFVYYLAASAMAALGRNGVVDATLASWTPNIIVGIAGAVLLRKVER
ncbi:MAG TPA: LptF/LptG family permease [Candidatus Acidoferrales bacterium]|nr:LptF/LptG family permease [Candidatus Acidoferrales bacterium]